MGWVRRIDPHMSLISCSRFYNYNNNFGGNKISEIICCQLSVNYKIVTVSGVQAAVLFSREKVLLRFICHFLPNRKIYNINNKMRKMKFSLSLTDDLTALVFSQNFVFELVY